MNKKIKFKIPKSVMKLFLEKREKAPVRILKYVKLGAGWHGAGYKITYKTRQKVKNTILRTLNPVSFSHDYASDRASVFVMQNSLFNSIPHHVKSIDVAGYSSGKNLVSLGDAKEFFQIVEVAEGRPYVEDLTRIAKTGKLEKSDIRKALMLSDYLVKLHRKRFKGQPQEERSVKLRHLRDAIGHGEMLMGVLDTYPARVDFADPEMLAEIVCRAVKFNTKIKEKSHKLVQLHGDFHPGNIWFKKASFTLLDASRQPFGLAADDLTALAINYIWFAVQTTGRFEGVFKELFTLFWNNYLKKTKDKAMELAAPLFFAFRAVVVAHPVFYPDQKNSVREKIFNFILNSLNDNKFSASKINSYLGV